MSISWTNGCRPAAIRAFLNGNAQIGTDLRALRLYRKGEMVNITTDPYRPDDCMHLYSLSKSFTSTAVGIARDMGLLQLDERIIDIFPDCVPPEISDNLAAMTLGDVLSMQSGHAACPLHLMRFSENAVKTFLSVPVVYKPGTTFVYSTGGTCICGAAVAKRSGMSLNAFMTEYIFSKLGIKTPRVIQLTDGTHAGGTGIYLSPDDVFRFGMMMLHEGEYNGQRIVSKEWCKLATTPIADNSCNGTPDWTAGYGYQFWRNARGGFRGDGAFGQLCVILPEEDTVVVQFAASNNMQAELSHIYTLLDSIDGIDNAEQKELEEDVRAYHRPPVSQPVKQVAYRYAPNPIQLEGVTLSMQDDQLLVRMETAYGVQYLKAGNGCWVESNPMLRYCNANIFSLDPCQSHIEQLLLRSCFIKEGDNVRVIARHPDTTHTQTFLFAPDGLHLSCDVGDLHPDTYFIPCR